MKKDKKKRDLTPSKELLELLESYEETDDSEKTFSLMLKKSVNPPKPAKAKRRK